jgi:hypothetical protein
MTDRIVARSTEFYDEWKDRSAWLKTVHPAMQLRTLACQQIVNISVTDHGTLLVKFIPCGGNFKAGDKMLVGENYHDVRYAAEKQGYVEKDCKVIRRIYKWDDEGTMKIPEVRFEFLQYFTPEKQKELEEDYVHDSYDDLGELVEY